MKKKTDGKSKPATPGDKKKTKKIKMQNQKKNK
jgi:hypothetical protein